MLTARVVLRGSATYKVQGRTWLKDVPGVVKGEDQVKAYEQNGYFHVKRLQSKKEAASSSGGQKKLVKRGAQGAKPEEK